MGPGASSHSSAEPSVKKRVRPEGNMGSLSRSPSMANLTYFIGFSADVGLSLCHTLLLDSQDIVYKFRSFKE